MSGSLTDAWQRALAAEEQAAFGYGLLGPHLSGSDLALAVACSDDHETLRNTVEARLADTGIAPVQPLPDYPALYPVDSAAAARALAARLERDCAAAWRYCYARAAMQAGSPATALRTAAQAALTAAAVRATRWDLLAGATPTVPFPGVDVT